LSRDSLDDWIYYFKHNAVPENSKARGLNKVAHLLKIDQMDTTTKYEYEAYIKDRVISRSMLETAKFEGREEGREVHFIFSHCARFLIKFRLFVVAFNYDAIY
jgi:hypothetical protein